MILIDTSIWADHFHRPIPALLDGLTAGQIVHHAFVTGELALGNLTDRMRMVRMLDLLPRATIVDADQLIAFVEKQQIGGTGVGLVDAHLLASASEGAHRLWTRDRRLTEQAERLGLLHMP